MRPFNLFLTILLLIPAMAAGKQWALVVNGDEPSSCTAGTHSRNVDLAVETMLELGFERDHVVVLAHPPEDEGRPGWRNPNRSNLRQAVADLAARVGPQDKIVLYLTGHGYRFMGRSHLALGQSLVSASWLAKELGGIRYGELIIVSDQCFSGGMDEEFTDLPRSVFVSSASADQKTSCVAFIRPFWRALTDPKHDDNGDGYVSVEEAFVVASARAARRAVATRPSDPIYRGLDGETLAQASDRRPTMLAAHPLIPTTIAGVDRLAAVAPTDISGGM